jgi:exosome complex component RRP45
MRTPTLTFGPELGWVECALGKTRYVCLRYNVNLLSFTGNRVLAQVDAKMVKPQPERPFEGSITIHSEISPMASSDYEPGR